MFISGLINDFKPKILQLEKQQLEFHELVNELRDYAQKENIGRATTKHSATAFLSFVPPREVRGKEGKGGRQGRPQQRPLSDIGPGAKEPDFCNHFERRNAQFARGLTAEFFALSMTSTGLALKQFANRVQSDCSQLIDMGAKVDRSHVEGVFISGLIDDFKPKILQLEKQQLEFHELVNELWDYAQKENIGRATFGDRVLVLRSPS